MKIAAHGPGLPHMLPFWGGKNSREKGIAPATEREYTMAELLDRNHFQIDINRYNPNAFCLIHVELDEKGAPVDWTFVYVNEALAKLEGKTEEELLGHRFFDIFPDGSRKWLKPYYEAAYFGKSASIDEMSDEIGQYLHIEVYPTDDRGYCVCMMHDIRDAVLERTRQRKAREALILELEEERRINLEVRRLTTAMGMIYPLAISIDYLNDSYRMIEYEKFYNHTADDSGRVDELIRAGASTIPDEDSARTFWEMFHREAVMTAFREGRRELSLRHLQYADDGDVHYMETRVICTECSDDRMEAIAIARCVDDETELNRAIVEEARHAEIINAVSTIYTTIMEADIATHGYRTIKSVALMNTATAGETYGNFDEVMESVLQHFMAPDMRGSMREFLNLGTLAERLETVDTIFSEYRNPEGRWYEARYIVQKRDESGHALTALYVARDITREKEKEIGYREQLRQSALEAERANQSKTGFLRRMSHDIRTPLNGIVGMLHIAEQNRDDRKKCDECLEKIQHSANYLLDLVNNVLDISKLESGAIMLEHKPFDLGKLLLETLPVVTENAKDNGVVFIGGSEMSHIEHRRCIGSPVHLNRILMNIASNAVKYNRPGGTLSLYCNELSCDGTSATYEFVSEDTGLGMSEEFQKHAFEPFTQEGKETTTSFSGTGLGLSIVRDIVNLMGGTVELHSRENVGTTIRIVLPIELDKDARDVEMSVDDDMPAGLEGTRALVVEDNGINMEIAEAMLSEIGLEIETAQNGAEALAHFRESEPGHFDVIFMDMMMPVMDGLEATREIRALQRPDAKTVPIIAMTANAFAEDKKTCLDAGMNDHVGKPLSVRALRDVIRKYKKPV